MEAQDPSGTAEHNCTYDRTAHLIGVAFENSDLMQSDS